MSSNKKILIFGGGTISHVRSHCAISAPAYGQTARDLMLLCCELIPNLDPHMILTRMADSTSHIETNADVEEEVKKAVADPATKIVFFSAAMCDFNGSISTNDFERDIYSGKYGDRLNSSCEQTCEQTMELIPAKKVINLFRKDFSGRKDIFLVGFKTTCGLSEQEQYIAGLNLCKKASCNLVLCNDVKTRLNMVITPEEAKYHVTANREEALRGLVEMAGLRSHLTFTRSTVIAGEAVSWTSELIPESLRTVVNHCVTRGAYKPFNGATVGHFAAKLSPTTFLTSIRKTNFLDIAKNGLAKIETDGPDRVIAYGAKPSVGGQSQRIVFTDHEDCDCIVHFHCPIRSDSQVPKVSQREVECGSHSCGRQTSNGLRRFGNLYAVYLEQHGPNIVFHHSIDPQEVIAFIENNFILEEKTGGPVYL